MTVPSSIVFFPVANIGNTNTFYEQIIGLRLVQVQKSSTSECHIYDTGYGYIGFCQYNDGRTIPSGKQGMCISSYYIGVGCNACHPARITPSHC